MNDDHVSLDTGQMDMSAHDQTPDMSLDTSMSIREASTVADVTEKTIRRWIKSGRLHAVKLGGQYRITIADLDRARESDVQTSDTQRPDTGHDSPRVDMSSRLNTGQNEGRQTDASIDLAPLVDHIAKLEKEVSQLVEASTVWQLRAAQREEQLKQLEASIGDQQKLEDDLASWRFRAERAEEEVQRLTILEADTGPRQDAPPESVESPESHESPLQRVRALLRRLLGG